MRVLVLLAAALGLAALAAGSAAGQSTGACSTAAARSAAASLKPRIVVPGQGRQVVEPARVGTPTCADLTGDGRVDMTVEVTSGFGIAGVIGVVVFRATPDGWATAFTRSGVRLEERVRGRTLEIGVPLFRSRDEACCPSGGVDWSAYRWRGSAFERVRTWHVASS